jgi:hypothetical protein
MNCRTRRYRTGITNTCKLYASRPATVDTLFATSVRMAERSLSACNTDAVCCFYYSLSSHSLTVKSHYLGCATSCPLMQIKLYRLKVRIHRLHDSLLAKHVKHSLRVNKQRRRSDTSVSLSTVSFVRQSMSTKNN